MSQITSGMRSILSNPVAYNLFQDIVGSKSARKAYVDTYLRPSDNCRVLDIGCGTARILEYMPKVEYFGFDLSQEYIDYAQRKYGVKGTFKCQMIERQILDEFEPFDLVVASGILHHLDDENSKALIELAYSALRTGGRLVTKDPCFSDDQHWISRFLVSRDRGQNVRRGHEYLSLAKISFDHVNSKLVHTHWLPYTHWIMQCSK